ncbi:MAG: hypothetical protein M3Q73_03380 [bacterium]|nr:hypothetical protein [bacterium]
MAPKMHKRHIIAGPGRYDLTVYGPTSDKQNYEQPRLRFTVTDGRQDSEEWITIVKIGREDGSGHNFIIDGYNANGARVNIFYTLRTTQGQKGHMVFHPFKTCGQCKGDQPLNHRFCAHCGTELPKT